MKKFALTLIVLSVMGAVAASAKSEVAFLSHELKPFSFLQNGVPEGFMVELIDALDASMGQHTAFEFVPFPRLMKMVQDGPNLAGFPVAYTDERSPSMQWVGPVITNGVYFYTRRGEADGLTILEDLAELPRISVARGNVDYALLQEYGFTNLDVVNQQKTSFLMLHHRRANATPAGELVFAETARSVGLDPKDFEKSKVKLYDSALFIVFSRDVSEQIVARWQSALDAFKLTREYRELVQRHFGK